MSARPEATYRAVRRNIWRGGPRTWPEVQALAKQILHENGAAKAASLFGQPRTRPAPVQSRGKQYEPNGERECARRARQTAGRPALLEAAE